MKAEKYLKKLIEDERENIKGHYVDKFEEYTHLDGINGALEMAYKLKLINKKKYNTFTEQVSNMMDYLDDL